MFNTVQAGFSCITAILSCVTQILTGNFTGKAEIGPEMVHIDAIESGETIKHIDMIAFRADASLICQNGWTVKPTFRYGSKKGKYTRTGVSLGYAMPFSQRMYFIPTVGYLYTRLNTKIDTPMSELSPLSPSLTMEKVNERFRAASLTAGGEVIFLVTQSISLSGSYQYAWSRSHTKLEDLLKAKDHTSGQLYTAVLDYRFCQKVGLHIGGEYDSSLAKETFGLRTISGKAGLTYWF